MPADVFVRPSRSKVHVVMHERGVGGLRPVARFGIIGHKDGRRRPERELLPITRARYASYPVSCTGD